MQSMVYDKRVRMTLQSWNDSTWKIVSGCDFGIEYFSMASPYRSHRKMKYRPGTGYQNAIFIENERHFGIVHNNPETRISQIAGDFMHGLVPTHVVKHLIPWQFPHFFEHGEKFCAVTLFDNFSWFDRENEEIIKKEQAFLFFDKCLVFARGKYHNTTPYFLEPHCGKSPKEIYCNSREEDFYLPICNDYGEAVPVYLNECFSMKTVFEAYGGWRYWQHKNRPNTKPPVLSLDGFRNWWRGFLKDYCVPRHLFVHNKEDTDTYIITKSEESPFKKPTQKKVLLDPNDPCPGPEVVHI